MALDPSAIRALPKAELHVHLFGAVPRETFSRLVEARPPARALDGAPERHRRMFERFPNIREFIASGGGNLEGLFRFSSFEQFLATYCFSGYFLKTRDDLSLLIEGVLDSLAAEGVVYAEIAVSAREQMNQGIPLEEIAGCLEGASRHPSVRVGWIVDLVRDFGPDAALDLVRGIVGLRSPHIVGITIGGSEHRFPPELFEGAYRVAREAGLRLTAHAGEGLGPGSVRGALDVLGVERVGHGVRAAEDPALLRLLAARGIPLEICPTSNLRTGIYPSYAAHPLRLFHRAGIPVTVSTDDPTFFGTTLCGEYQRLLEMGLTEADLLEVAENGFRHAFLPEPDKARYLDGLRRAWEGLEGGRFTGTPA